jgi:hypothetical protein
MINDVLPEAWSIIRDWLPDDLNERAYKDGFFLRARGLSDAELWLRLILMHVAGGLSLKQTVVRARELDLAEISSVALFKRLRRSQKWLQGLTGYLLAVQQKKLGRFNWPYRYRLRIIDASNIQEPGSTGTDWRLHYSIRLPELTCDHYELTDDQGGEKLGCYHFEPDEMVLVDRGYSHRAGVAHVLDASAQVIFRWNPGLFPLEAPNGKPLVLLPRLRGLGEGQAAEWPVQFVWQQKTYALRLCALRKGQLAAQRALRRAQRKAEKNGTQAQAEALELTAYVLVLTSDSSLPLQAVLELYRGRWQVELVFKRLKSLLDAGQLPKNDDASALAWMQAKILTALLVDRILLEGKFFSPWGFTLR